MKEIFLTIRKIYEQNKHKWSADYALGFADAIKYLLIGIEKSPVYNLELKLQEKNKEIKERDKLYSDSERKIRNLQHEISILNKKLKK